MFRSFRIVLIAFVSLAAFALTDTAWAQPGPGGPGRMFGRNFNPSLSMMYSMLLNSPTVQKDLDLVDEQKAKLKEATDKARATRREMMSGMGDMSDLTDKERRAKWEEMGKKMQAQGEKDNKIVEGILLPDQLKRLKEIAVQRAGVMALSDKDIQKQLKLSDDQVAKIKSIGEDAMKKMGELFAAGPGGDRDTMRKKMDEMRKETEKKVVDVLTADQKTSFEKMKGKTLKIPDSELFGPGFGGRGGRGGRGGAGGGGNGGGGGDSRPTE
jgi:Spy/CpxP family protein refolding chaperone